MNIFNRESKKKKAKPDVWARPKMKVSFRAELMPGKSKEERTFVVDQVLGNGRVTLFGFEGEHRESEFDAVSFN